MILIPDDPIVRCVERTGYPPWVKEYPDLDDEFEIEDGDEIYYGNDTIEF